MKQLPVASDRLPVVQATPSSFSYQKVVHSHHNKKGLPIWQALNCEPKIRTAVERALRRGYGARLDCYGLTFCDNAVDVLVV